MTPGNLADDVPEWIGRQDDFFNISMYTDYKCNWRWLVDNWPQDHHAQYVHRNSPELFFQPQLPYALTLEPKPLDGNKGLAIKRSGGMTSADYPGLGRFPEERMVALHETHRPRQHRGLREFQGAHGLRHQEPVRTLAARPDRRRTAVGRIFA